MGQPARWASTRRLLVSSCVPGLNRRRHARLQIPRHTIAREMSFEEVDRLSGRLGHNPARYTIRGVTIEPSSRPGIQHIVQVVIQPGDEVIAGENHLNSVT